MFLELYSPVTLRKIKSQLFLTKVRWLYFHILLLQEALEFASGWKLWQSGCNARSRDLSILVKEEGYKGNFLTLKAESLAKAIEAILNNDDYRRELAMTNYKAACELSMDKIQMYIGNFKQVNYNKLLRWVND
jgi:hypothetical protein